jgi:hypothetical protein
VQASTHDSHMYPWYCYVKVVLVMPCLKEEIRVGQSRSVHTCMISVKFCTLWTVATLTQLSSKISILGEPLRNWEILYVWCDVVGISVKCEVWAFMLGIFFGNIWNIWKLWIDKNKTQIRPNNHNIDPNKKIYIEIKLKVSMQHESGREVVHSNPFGGMKRRSCKI